MSNRLLDQSSRAQTPPLTVIVGRRCSPQGSRRERDHAAASVPRPKRQSTVFSDAALAVVLTLDRRIDLLRYRASTLARQLAEARAENRALRAALAGQLLADDVTPADTSAPLFGNLPNTSRDRK